MKNCTGIRCVRQLGTVDPATCSLVSICPEATPPLTKGDLVRTMNDEELAKLLHDHSCSLCPIKDCDGRIEVGRGACYSKWLNWLKQEAFDG